MSFTAQFTISQASAGSPVTVTDSSSYANEGQGTFSSRSLSIQDIYGNELGSVPFPFSAGNSYSFTTLKDLSLKIVLTLVSTNPQSGSTYVATGVAVLTNYSYLFLYGIAQDITANPSIKNQVEYYQNLERAWTDLKNATNAGNYSDQYSAQGFLDDIYLMIQNKSTFFG